MTGYMPTQLAFTIVSQYGLGSVSVTIQVWDYQANRYPEGGEGRRTYASSATPSTDETETLTITTDPFHHASSGNAKVRITGVGTTTTQFQQKTNQVRLEYEYSPITQIVFTTPAQTITAGEASAIMTIQARDASGHPVKVLSDTTIALSSSSGNGKFSLSTTPWVDVSSVTITAGSSTVSFYYKDTAAGTATITAAEWPSQGWTDATQLETANPMSSPVETATGTGSAAFSPDVGVIESLTAVSESTLPSAGKPSLTFPHGFFMFRITGLRVGQAVTVTVALPSDLPTTASYWKYHAGEGGWIQIPMGSNDGDNVITITLVDGGVGDDDGTANGVIVDQGGPGNPPSRPVGGVVMPVNKLIVLSPYLVLLGLLGAAIVVVAVRKSRKA
jgi:hypothetical protein